MEQTDREEQMEQEEPRGAKRSHIYVYVTYICQRRGAHKDRSKEHRERAEDTAIGATED